VNKNPTDATVCRYLFTAKLLYMFRVSQHPSSGVLKTVPAAFGTGHTTCTATPILRGLIGTDQISGFFSSLNNSSIHVPTLSFILVALALRSFHYTHTVVAFGCMISITGFYKVLKLFLSYRRESSHTHTKTHTHTHIMIPLFPVLR